MGFDTPGVHPAGRTTWFHLAVDNPRRTSATSMAVVPVVPRPATMIRELEALRAREACKLVATMSGGGGPTDGFR